MQVAATVMEATTAGLVSARDAAARPRAGGRAALAELRLDALAACTADDVAACVAGRPLPVIVTCRPSWEGGRFEGDEASRLALLASAVAAGAEWVDLEFEAVRRDPGVLARLGVPNSRTGLVLSFHDHAGGATPALADRLREMRRVASGLTGGDVVIKVAVTPATLSDTVTLAAIAGGPTADVIVIGMGPAGVVTRLAAHRFSGRWAYAAASVEPGAPGQLSLDTLLDRYRAVSISASTAIYGIAGQPLGHSASPAMHNAAFAAAGLDAVFVPFESADAAEVLAVAEALQVRGLAVTAPLKSRLLAPGLNVRPDHAAAAIGAVNTLRRGADGWDARNFDAEAFSAPLIEAGGVEAGARAIVLGAGGAARAAAVELTRLGAAVEISARRDEAASTLAAELGVTATAWPPAGAAAIVVNATPVGTAPHVEQSPLAGTALAAALAYDLVYNPEHTRFLADARRAGARTIGGLAMLAAQARRQNEWWTGRALDTEVFARAAREFVGGEGPHS